MFQGSFNGVLRKFQGRFREVTWIFLSPKRQGSFKSVSRKFQGCFKEV